MRTYDRPRELEATAEQTSAAADGAVIAPTVAQLEIATLAEPLPLRDGPLDAEHVRSLASCLDQLPPVVVHGPTRRLVDGRHRVAAARLAGRARIPARLIDGSEADALVVAIRSNISDGRELTIGERVAAAGRLLESHADRSDRWIASICGVSPRTVGNVRRRRAVEAEAADPATQSRVGRDGRRRPLSADEGRRAAAAIMRDEPEISLRRVAERAGISVGTALDVRRRLAVGAEPEAGAPMPEVDARPAVSSAAKDAGGAGVVVGLRSLAPQRTGSAPELRQTLDRLGRDPSLRTDHGRALLRLVATTLSFDEHAEDLARMVPGYSHEVIVGIAHSCAAAWLEFGERLDDDAVSPRKAG